jgi:hypothetical protein
VPKKQPVYDVGDILMFTYDNIPGKQTLVYYAIIIDIKDGDYHFRYLDGDGEHDIEGVGYIDRSKRVTKIA